MNQATERRWAVASLRQPVELQSSEDWAKGNLPVCQGRIDEQADVVEYLIRLYECVGV